MSNLPTDPKERKSTPIGTGVIDYFPDALAEVSRVSLQGQKQHGIEGDTLQWDRSKSTDESDALIRHYVDRYKDDTDGMMHAAKMAWRALAFLQKLIEERRNTIATQPEKTRTLFAPGSKLSPPSGVSLPTFSDQILYAEHLYREGHTPITYYYCADDSTTIFFDPGYGSDGYRFVVRGKFSWTPDGLREEVQPGPLDSSIKNTTLWEPSQVVLPEDPSYNYGIH